MSNDVTGLSVAEAIAFTPEHLNSLDHDEAKALRERVSSAATSKAALLELASGPAGKRLFSKIAQNPNADEAVLSSLAPSASKSFIQDWGLLAGRFVRLYAPYTESLDSRQPYSEVFADQTFNNSNLATAYVFHVGVALAEDLWHDLMEDGSAELFYYSGADWTDPSYFGFTLNGQDAEAPVSAILSPFSDAPWLDLVGRLDIMAVFESLDWDRKHDVDTGAYQTQDNLEGAGSFDWLTAAVYGVSSEQIQIIDWGKLDVFLDLSSNFLYDYTAYEVDVVGVPEVIGKRFSDLSAKQITNVITNLLTANESVFMQHSGVAKHLLEAILVHPALTEAHKRLIQEAV